MSSWPIERAIARHLRLWRLPFWSEEAFLLAKSDHWDDVRGNK